MTTNGHEFDLPDQLSAPEAEEPKAPLYEVEQVLGLLHELTPGSRLADSISSVDVDLDPAVGRLLDAYEILRGETVVAKRDRKMISLLLQGKRPNEVLDALDPADLLGGKGQPLRDPKQTVITVRKEFSEYFIRSNIYRPENVAFMLARYMSSQDAVDSIPLPSSKTQRPMPPTGRSVEVRAEEKDQVEHWLTKGFAKQLTAKQVEILGGYLLGATLTDTERAAARRHIEGIADIIAVAETQTPEFAAQRYRTREFQKLLVFNPDRAAVLVDMIAKSNVSDEPVFNASANTHATSYQEALERIARDRTKVIQALRHVVVLASVDPEQPGGKE